MRPVGRRQHTIGDAAIRSALIETLHRNHADDGSLILTELGLRQGRTRVDVAVVNGEISGYEIKSSADTLLRFAHQQALYSEVLDRAWIVTTDKHLEHVEPTLPRWWGIVEACESEDNSAQLTITREATRNPGQNPEAVVQLLWRSEALDLLIARGTDGGVRSKPRRALWGRLVETWEPEELYEAVREAIKTRTKWRKPDRPRLRHGVKSPDGAIFLESLDHHALESNPACTDLLG